MSKLLFCDPLPSESARPALERPDNIRGNPAAVKIAFLGLHALVVDVTGVDFAGVKGEVVGDGLIGTADVGIAPADGGARFSLHNQIPVNGLALELAVSRSPLALAQPFRAHVFRWQVINRRMTGFQDSVALVGICNDLIIDPNADVLCRGLQLGRAGVVPYTLLARLWWYAFFHTAGNKR